ncbi:unnamed protein product [Arabidopsis lyrata]|uniref:RNase H type-1 domain-containing protein n=1 Tax=Arabidopsis lyrata subsp. lyrata TaxID=81972 RepID=D7KZ58_ARALL|nr:hypothetical protein ARALYDRAFT_893860 [Arabidopsis lyrata subsp. lyrata]CAH8256902.1 unnamed protein product [Arabidopsis lyrata]
MPTYVSFLFGSPGKSGRVEPYYVFQRKHIPWGTSLNLARADAKQWTEAETLLTPPTQQTTNHAMTDNNWWIHQNQVGLSDASFVNGDFPSKTGWVLRDNDMFYVGVGQAIGKTTSNVFEEKFEALIIAMQHC